MRDAEQLYAQIEARRSELGLTQAQLGEIAFGRSDTSAIQNIRRGASPSFERLGAIADALDFELYFGPRRPQPTAEVSPVDQGMAQQSAEFSPIPVYDAALAAGQGWNNEHSVCIGEIAFRKSWLRENRVSVADAVAAHVEGDSMSPSIHSGDMILIDRSKRLVKPRKRAPQDTRPSPIYALLDGGKARVKRIERPGEGLIILQSDNPAYGPEVKTGSDIEALNIIGKVVWWGHTVRD